MPILPKSYSSLANLYTALSLVILRSAMGKDRYYVSKHREMSHIFIFAEIFQASEEFRA